jgi:hypothetical protein
MTLYPRQFVALMDGRAGGVAGIAHLPRNIGAQFSAQTENVLIERSYAEKIILEHQIRFEDLEYVQRAINEGYMLRGRQANFIEFAFIESDRTYRHYLLVLKPLGSG